MVFRRGRFDKEREQIGKLHARSEQGGKIPVARSIRSFIRPSKGEGTHLCGHVRLGKESADGCKVLLERRAIELNMQKTMHFCKGKFFGRFVRQILWIALADVRLQTF